MMKKLAQWAGYIALGGVAYILFLYWTFPFDNLKGRLEGGIEKALGPDYDIRISHISPSFITGVVLKGVSLTVRSGGVAQPMLDVDRAKLRVGLFSLLLGNPEASFSLQFKKSTIDGSVTKRDNNLQIVADLDPVQLTTVPWFASVLGLKLAGNISGTLTMTMPLEGNKPSEGAVNLVFQGGELQAGSKIPLGQAGSMDITNAIKFAQGKDSKLVMKWSKGLVDLSSWKWADGDIQLDLKGQAFTAMNAANTRLNVNGTITLSPQFEKDFPILTMISKQKQADGSYAISVTGNLNHPAVKVGEFTLPL